MIYYVIKYETIKMHELLMQQSNCTPNFEEGDLNPTFPSLVTALPST